MSGKTRISLLLVRESGRFGLKNVEIPEKLGISPRFLREYSGLAPKSFGNHSGLTSDNFRKITKKITFFKKPTNIAPLGVTGSLCHPLVTCIVWPGVRETLQRRTACSSRHARSTSSLTHEILIANSKVRLIRAHPSCCMILANPLAP
jgi:hypothetical protein